MKKIIVIGLGYVGLSNAILLAKYNLVIGIDLDEKKINQINNKISPIKDVEISNSLKKNNLNFMAYKYNEEHFQDADFIIIATPTNYDPVNNFFDTSTVEEQINNIKELNANATIVIRSTIPVGFTEKIKAETGMHNIFFCPEFLREGSALLDNLYPSRLIIGSTSKKALEFGSLLVQGAAKEDIPILYTGENEAEAIKLFSNTYLAMRVAFFNELDSFALINGYNSRDIIDGISLDSRIGDKYNNPSFGYGGYCLPKDTKQLLANFNDVKQNLMQAIVDSNSTRKELLADEIIKSEKKIIGIYRLVMKEGSDNFRESSVLGIIDILIKNGLNIIIYEPQLNENNKYFKYKDNDLNKFKKKCDLVIANRLHKEIDDIKSKVFTRDIFRVD